VKILSLGSPHGGKPPLAPLTDRNKPAVWAATPREAGWIYQILPRNPGWLSDLFILGSQTLGVSICINFWDQNSLTMPCFSHELRAQLKFTTFGTSDDVTIDDSKSTATSRCCSLSLSTSVYLILPIYSTHTLRISNLYLCTLYVLLMYILCMYY